MSVNRTLLTKLESVSLSIRAGSSLLCDLRLSS